MFNALHNFSPPVWTPPHGHPFPFPQICLLCPPLCPSRLPRHKGEQGFQLLCPLTLEVTATRHQEPGLSPLLQIKTKNSPFQNCIPHFIVHIVLFCLFFLLLFLFKYVLYGVPRVPREVPLNKMYYYYYHYYHYYYYYYFFFQYYYYYVLILSARWGRCLSLPWSWRFTSFSFPNMSLR